MNIEKAHKLSYKNKDLIVDSKKCGCFYCLKIYEPKEINEWVDDGNTAVCPRCGIDAVLPEHPGYTLDDRFLKKMRYYYFTTFRENPSF